MSESLLRLPDVTRRTGKSVSLIYKEMDAGTFPRPLKRGRASVWIESEVQAAIEREIETLPRMGKSMGRVRKSGGKPLKQAVS